jgi:hypothetical protein
MTNDINDWWAVTVSHAKKVGPKYFEGSAYAFRRDNQQRVGPYFTGSGTTMNAADDDAKRKARYFALEQGKPNDWSDSL